MLRVILGLVCAWALAACAELPRQAAGPVPAQLLHDEWFQKPSSVLDADVVFAVDDAMRRYLTEHGHALRREGRAKGLIDALYNRSELKLEYDASHTRTASQAFAARAGNCLSLVLMTAALAKELGLSVQYQSAFAEETWTRSGALLLRSGHINITLGPRMVDRGSREDPRSWTVDFLGAGELRGLRTRPIAEATVVAMFMNNRAAEALARDDNAEAYWWVRQGVLADPGFLGALNTLGVTYRRAGRDAAAEQMFVEVLRRDPQHTQALHNAVQLLEQQGRHAEAQPLAARLAALEPEPPYHWFVQGQQALRRGDARAARELFAREVARADYSAEFHFWLALAHHQLGEEKDALHHLQRAEALSTTRGERDLYAAKLAWLNQRRQ